MSTLTHKRLLEVLRYNRRTGVFTWRVATSRRVKAGGIAGTPREGGYRAIMLDGTIYLSHRLAWFYVHGRWPAADTDHKYGTQAGDRLNNLREATRSQNNQNRRNHPPNRSGFVGVTPNGSGFCARIYLENESIYLGQYSTPKAARAAYQCARSFFHPFAQ